MKEAKKEAKRRYERKVYAEDGERRRRMNNARRARAGLPSVEEVPLMKPWDFAKGKVVAKEDKEPTT